MYEDVITSDAENRDQDVNSEFPIVGSAGISGLKSALKEFSAYAPQERNPYETLGKLASPSWSRSRVQEPSNITRHHNHDDLPDFGAMEPDNFFFQAEDFGRAVNDWINFDMTDI